jgi:hypothetical protein
MTAQEILQQRRAVVAAAIDWIGTPFHHDAAVKGAGCDCSHLGMAYSEAMGIALKWPKVYINNPQWFLNQGPDNQLHEIYLEGMLDLGFIELSDGQSNFEPFREGAWIDARKETGDCAIAMMGRIYAHGAIIDQWPNVIQAESHINGRGAVCRATAHANYFLSHRPLKFFSRKEWHAVL